MIARSVGVIHEIARPNSDACHAPAPTNLIADMDDRTILEDTMHESSHNTVQLPDSFADRRLTTMDARLIIGDSNEIARPSSGA